MKTNYIIKEVPGPRIIDTENIVYPYESTDVFWDESLDTVPIEQQVSIYNRFRHFCPHSCFLLPLWLLFGAITAS